MGQNEKKYSILDELAKCSGYDIALMTTFNFEIGFFERAVLNRLYAKDVRKISLFVDSKELANALQEVDIKHNGSNIGRKYMVNPIPMNSSFHPKVILLLGKKKARLFVGSANIKTSGYAINNEVFNFIDYSPEHPEYLDVIVAAIDFFSEINDASYKLDDEIIRETKNYVYYHRVSKSSDVRLIHNMSMPILAQAVSLIKTPVKSISISVPYYDKELMALKALKDSFPGAKIQLFIQNENSTFPIEYNDKNRIVNDINPFTGFKDNDSSSSRNFYHGKVFLFKTDTEEYVLYGSANCTQAALTRSYRDGGNVECVLFEKGTPGEFEYFFENMLVEKSTKLTSHPMDYTATETSNFVFKFGESNGDILLHISYVSKPEAVEIKIGDKKLEGTFDGDELIVIIPEQYRDTISDIFDITISFDDKKEIVRCWTYSPVILSNFRAVQDNREDFSNFDINSTGDKFLEDRIRFFKAEATCLSEWQEYKKSQMYMNQIKQEQEGEDGEAEDFIIDFEIPDEYRFAYRQYTAVARIREEFVRRFLSLPVTNGPGQDDKNCRKYDVIRKDNVEVKARKATTAEKSFERFIKGKVKGMLNDLYIEVVELDHYIGIVQVVMEIFDKYNNEDIVEDIFTNNYVIDTTVSFLIRILEKSYDDPAFNKEKKEALIYKCVYILLESYCYYRKLPESEERYKFESINRGLLTELEKLYQLREKNQVFLDSVIDSAVRTGLPLAFDEACNYIEKLYGYKTFEMLKTFISKYYSNPQIWHDDGVFKIEAESAAITEHLKPLPNVLKEIDHYSREVEVVNKIMIKIKNVEPNPNKKNVIRIIKHSIITAHHQWIRTEIRENGEKFDSKYQFINY